MNATVRFFSETLPNNLYSFSGNLENRTRLKKLSAAEATSLKPLNFASSSGLFQSGFGGKGGPGSQYHGKYSIRTALELEVINANNPGMPIGNPELEKEGGSLLGRPRKKYPWSCETNLFGAAKDCSIVYSFVGKVEGGIETGNIPLGTSASTQFGLNAGSELVASHVKVHDPNTKLNRAIEEDLMDEPGYRFPLDAGHLVRLAPGQEFLMTRHQTKFGFQLSVTWGQVFRADPGLARALFPDNAAFEAAGGESLLDAAQVGAKAKLNLRTDWEAPLELIAYRPANDRVRIEYRKSSVSNTTAGLDFNVSANLMSREQAKKALTELLSYYSGYAETGVAEIKEKMDSVLGRIDEQLTSLGGLVDLFEGQAEEVRNAIQNVAQTLEDQLGIAANDLIRLEGRKQELEEVLGSAIPQWDSGLSLDSSFESLRNHFSRIEEAEFSEATRHWFSRIQLATGWTGLDIRTLVPLLSVGRVRNEITTQLGNLDELEEVLDLENYRQQILTEIEDVLNLEAAGEEITSLLASLQEKAGISIADVASVISLESRIQEFLPDVEKEAWGKVLEKVRSFSLSDVIDLEEAEKALVAPFGEGLDRFRGRIDLAIDRIASAVSKACVISARFEYQHKRENEALLSFDYRINPGSEAPELEEVYHRLLFGDWEYARTQIAANEGSRYGNVEFFAAEKVTERKSFALNVLVGDFGQKAIDTWQKTTELSGKMSFEMTAALENEGKWGWNSDRSWNCHETLYANSRGFSTEGNFPGRAFDFRLVSGLAFGGIAEEEGVDINTKHGNWEMLQTLAESFDGTVSGAPVSQRLLELKPEINGGEPVYLGFSLTVEPKAISSIWESSPDYLGPIMGNYAASDSVWVRNYLSRWPRFAKLRPGPDNGFTGSENSNFKQYCAALAQMSDAAGATGNSHEDVYEVMRKWRKRKNVAGSAANKFDKFCYFTTLVSILPENGAGWSLGAELRCGGKQFYFG